MNTHIHRQTKLKRTRCELIARVRIIKSLIRKCSGMPSLKNDKNDTNTSRKQVIKQFNEILLLWMWWHKSSPAALFDSITEIIFLKCNWITHSTAQHSTVQPYTSSRNTCENPNLRAQNARIYVTCRIKFRFYFSIRVWLVNLVNSIQFHFIQFLSSGNLFQSKFVSFLCVMPASSIHIIEVDNGNERAKKLCRIFVHMFQQ